MSWDIGAYVWVDHQMVMVVDPVNYTHNCNEMIRAAGFEDFPHHLHGMKTGDFVAAMKYVLIEWENNREKYAAMNPENGWGNFGGLWMVMEDLIGKLSAFPSAFLYVSN